MKRFYIGIFIGILTLSGGVTLFAPERTYSEFENRVLSQRPKAAVSAIVGGGFEKDLESFLNDQFPLRDACVTVKTAVSYALGRRLENGILFGRDGMLIERYKDSDFSKKQVKENVAYLAEMVNLAAGALGEEHVKCVLIPSKATVLKNKMPSFADSSDYYLKMEHALEKKLDAPGQTLLKLDAVLAKHQDEAIYYRSDHHWTSLGARYAYEAISGHDVNLEVEQVADDFLGTDYNKVHIGTKSDTIEKYMIPQAEEAVMEVLDNEKMNGSIYKESALGTRDKYAYFLGGNYGVVNIKTGTKNGKTLVLVKDSYSNSLVPFFCQDYERICMLDVRYLNAGIMTEIEKLDGMDDFYIIYNEEKFMQDGHQWLLN